MQGVHSAVPAVGLVISFTTPKREYAIHQDVMGSCSTVFG